MGLQFEPKQDRLEPDAWRVEAIDYDRDGVVFIAVFSGPGAQDRAEEYAAFKNDGASGGRLDVDIVHAGLRP
jgi:hypothetical protein